MNAFIFWYFFQTSQQVYESKTAETFQHLGLGECYMFIRWPRGKKKIKQKKKKTLQHTLGCGMHHCVDDVCDDRWQLKRGCSRTVVSDCWLWCSLGLLGICCCVLFNNPNPLSPPQPTSVLWLFLVFFYYVILRFNNLRCTTMLAARRGRAEQVPQTVPPKSFRLQGSLVNP